ncbi:hypothetical protein DYB28_003819, partial [Aphanomyces astaci]
MNDDESNNDCAATALDSMTLPTVILKDDGSDESSPRIGGDAPLTLMGSVVESLEQLCRSFEVECDQRLSRMQVRVDSSTAAIPRMKAWVAQQHETTASLEAQLDESVAKCKSVLQKWTKEKEDRRNEKEWIADLWPEFVVVPPTILRPFMKTTASMDDKAQLGLDATMQLRLMEQGRLVQERMALASQWSAVDNYFYNAVTGESCWEPPPAMTYVAPTGWDVAKGKWKPGVQLTLDADTLSAAQSPNKVDATTNNNDSIQALNTSTINSAREISTSTDSEADAPLLDPISLRAQVESEHQVLDKLHKDVASSTLRLQTLSHQLQTSIRRHLDSEQAGVQAEYDALVEAERKKLAKEARDRHAAAMEAQAKAKKQQARSSSSPPKNKLQAAELVIDDVPEAALVIPIDPTRLRLCTPVSHEPMVQLHTTSDTMYLHMETVQRRVDALVKKEDLAWESHDAFRGLIEKDMGQAKQKLDAMLGKLLAFEQYDRDMRAWEEAEVSRRVECEDLVETIADMQTRLKEAATVDRICDEVSFLEALEKCEAARGAGLWAKKKEYEMWRTKVMLDRVDRYIRVSIHHSSDSQSLERLVALARDLDEFTAHLDAAARLPLQAINILEKTRLEGQRDDQVAYYTAKIDKTTSAIVANEGAKAKLMEMELRAVEFHGRRLDEEMQLHEETKGVWMRQRVTCDSGQQDVLRAWLLLNYTREGRWRELWVARLSSEATDALQETKLEFDDVVACSSSSMNLTADATTHERCHSHLDRLHVLQETDYWVSSSAIPVSINEVNVLSIGDTSGALAILIELSCASSQEV